MAEAVNSSMFHLCGRVLEAISKSSVDSLFLQSQELLSMSFKKSPLLNSADSIVCNKEPSLINALVHSRTTGMEKVSS